MARNKNQDIKDTNEVNSVVEDNITNPVADVKVDTYKIKVRKSKPNYNKSDIPVIKSTWVLVSRLNNPVYISYGSSSLLIPPRGKVADINPEMLGSLPKGIDYIVKNG